MNEKIQEFNLKMKELGINPNDFFSIMFSEYGETRLQCDYSAELSKKLTSLAQGNIDTNGYLDFRIEGFVFTLS